MPSRVIFATNELTVMQRLHGHGRCANIPPHLAIVYRIGVDSPRKFFCEFLSPYLRAAPLLSAIIGNFSSGSLCITFSALCPINRDLPQSLENRFLLSLLDQVENWIIAWRMGQAIAVCRVQIREKAPSIIPPGLPRMDDEETMIQIFLGLDGSCRLKGQI